MTLERLLSLEWEADELSKLTDADLLKILEPKLKITRPELADKPKSSSSQRTLRGFEENARVGRLKTFADKFGFDLDGLLDE